VPTDKRARKRAAREAKLAALERQRRRRSTIRRTVTIIVIVAVGVGIYALTKGSPAKLTAQEVAQNAANSAAVKAGCPSNPHTALSRPKWSTPPAMTIDPSKGYDATITTDVGTMVVQLDAAATPLAVNNFVFLADKGYYNCVIFHRVVPGFMDQSGDPTGTGQGTPGYKFADELPKKASPQYPVGSVAMANAGPNTNGSQFFIVTGSQGATLAPDYSLFGQVTQGMSVAQKINSDGNANPADSGVPPKVIHRMLKVTISTT
jgi:cyclophilin family peptidyl-prolyl cis-trans isomerase